MLTEITKLAESIHTTRKILRARLEKIDESLPAIPTGVSVRACLGDSETHGTIRLLVCNRWGLAVTHDEYGESAWEWDDVPARWIPEAAKAVENLLASLKTQMKAEADEETALAGKI
jgi:hypothetical protein